MDECGSDTTHSDVQSRSSPPSSLGDELADYDLLTLAFRRDGSAVVVEVRGELDLATGGLLEKALADLLDDQGCRSIAIDLRELSFLGSTGLSVLLKAHENARSMAREISLTRLSPMARRAIELGGLLSTFDIRDDDTTRAGQDTASE